MISGRLIIRLRDAEVVLEPWGELYVVGRGVEHCPFAAEETQVLLDGAARGGQHRDVGRRVHDGGTAPILTAGDDRWGGDARRGARHTRPAVLRRGPLRQPQTRLPGG